jgi:hypothetical protein
MAMKAWANSHDQVVRMNLNRGVRRLWLAVSVIWMILVMAITSYGSAAPTDFQKFYARLSVTESGTYFMPTRASGEPALTMVSPPRRELFVLDGVGWRKRSSPPDIQRAIDGALRGITDTGEKDKNWRTCELRTRPALKLTYG